jgi:hypothetical protein
MVRIVLTLVLALHANSPVYAQQQNDLDEMLAGVLMRNGFLCSRVVEKRQTQGAEQIEVTCIEYRGGTRRVRSLVDLSTGKAFKPQ